MNANDNGLDPGALPEMMKKCSDGHALAMTAVMQVFKSKDTWASIEAENVKIEWDEELECVVVKIDATESFFSITASGVVKQFGPELKDLGISQVIVYSSSIELI